MSKRMAGGRGGGEGAAIRESRIDRIDWIDRPLTPLFFLSSVSPTARWRTIPVSKTKVPSRCEVELWRANSLNRSSLKFAPSPFLLLSPRPVEQTMVRLVESFSADFRFSFSLFFFLKKTHARARELNSMRLLWHPARN